MKRTASARLDDLEDHVKVNDKMLRNALKLLALHETRVKAVELRLVACIERLDKVNGRDVIMHPRRP